MATASTQLGPSTWGHLDFGRPYQRPLYSSSRNPTGQVNTAPPLGGHSSRERKASDGACPSAKPGNSSNLNLLAGIATSDVLMRPTIQTTPPTPVPYTTQKTGFKVLDIGKQRLLTSAPGALSGMGRPSQWLYTIEANHVTGWGDGAPSVFTQWLQNSQWMYAPRDDRFDSSTSSQHALIGISSGRHRSGSSDAAHQMINNSALRQSSGSGLTSSYTSHMNPIFPGDGGGYHSGSNKRLRAGMHFATQTFPQPAAMVTTETHLQSEWQDDCTAAFPPDKKRRTRIGVPNTPKSLFVNSHDPAKEELQLITLKKYRCGYCGEIRVSSSTGDDGRIRIRCECGGKHQDQRLRMHAMWTIVVEDKDPTRKLTRKDFRARRLSQVHTYRDL